MNTPIELNDEHKTHYAEWRKKYIEIQLRTGPMDKKAIIKAVHGLYDAQIGHLPRILFSGSPTVAAIAGSIAEVAIDLSKEDIDPELIVGSLLKASREYQGCLDNYPLLKFHPNDIHFPTSPDEMIFGLARKAASLEDVDPYEGFCPYVDRMIENIANFEKSWNGGITCAYSHAHLTFFRDIMGVELPLGEAFRHYQYLNEHSGPRMQFEDVVIISELPVSIQTRAIGEGYHLHCVDGPATTWVDGASIYALENTTVPWWVVEQRETLTIDELDGVDYAIREICHRYLTERPWESSK